MYEVEEMSLRRAKIQLMTMENTAFYTTLLFSLKQSFLDSPEMKTAGTDGIHLWINPKYWAAQSEPQKLGLLCHEVLHVALDHMNWCGDRDHDKYNIAGDICIDNMLFENGYTMCDGDEYRPEYQGMSTDKIYSMLPDKPKRKGGGKKGIGNDITYPSGTPEEKAAIQEQITETILRAATQHQMSGGAPGAIPGEVLIALQERINPKLPWTQILQNHMTQFAKVDSSFTRPNRRFMPEFYLPTAYGEALCNIAGAFDLSGSTSDDQVSSYVGQLTVIQETLKPEAMTVIGFDTKIKNIQEMNPETNILKELKFNGRGGTNIAPVLEWAKENKPEVILIFTDGGFRYQPKPGNVPVVWIINDNPNWTCDYGRVVHYSSQGN